MSSFFSVGSFSRGSSRGGRRSKKVANAEWTEFEVKDAVETPQALRKKVVQLTAKLWEAEKKIAHLHADKSKQDTKFRAVKRAAQMETVLNKVKEEVDIKVQQAVTRRLSLEVEDQTAAERQRAEQAEEEAQHLKETIANQNREIEYLKGAKRGWQKRAKEAEELATKLASTAAAAKPGGETGLTPFQSLVGTQSTLAHILKSSRIPSPEDSNSPSRTTSRGYNAEGARPPSTIQSDVASIETVPVVDNGEMKRLSSPGPVHYGLPNPPSPVFAPNMKTMSLLMEDEEEPGQEAEMLTLEDVEENGGGEGEHLAQVDSLGFESQKFGEHENSIYDEEAGEWMVSNEQNALGRRDQHVEPLSFQEAYELSRDHSFSQPQNKLKLVFNNLIFLNNAESDWRKNRDAIDGKISTWSDRAAFFGLVGALSAVGQNELMFNNEQPTSGTMDVLKLVSLVLTVATAFCVFRLCKLTVLFHRVSMHMTRGWPLELDIHFSNVLKETSFVWEMVVVLPHLPPGFTFEFGASNMGNFVLYRGETIACLYNMFRVYLLWRVIKHRMLDAFPKRHTVATYTQTELQSSFAVKVMFDGWFAAFYVALLWLFLMIVLGYWFRSGEISACFLASATHPTCNETEAVLWTSNGVDFFEKTNDFYISNSAWAMFVTATSVGYGDIFPTTHLGRLVASISALVGIILIALLTAALAHGLTFTPEQHMALSLLEREKARIRLVKQAVNLIAMWWKLRKGTIRRTAKTAQKMYLLRTEFRRVKVAGSEDMDAFMVDTVKVNQLSMLMHRTRERIEEVEDLISGKKVVQLPASPEGEDDTASGRVAPLRSASVPGPGYRIATASSQGRQLNRSETEHKRRRFGPGKLQRQFRMGKRRFDPEGWKRSREKVEVERKKMSRRAAMVGVAGILLPVIQNELIYQKTNPTDPTVELFKVLNCICSIVLVYYIFQIYHMKVLFNRISRHLDYGQPFETERELSEVVQQKLMWVEMLLCVLHLPPLVTFEYGSMQLDNYVMYRGESILCFVNSLRVYLICRVLRDVELEDLPRVHTVKRFTGVEIGYVFALKRVFNSLLAVWYIAWLWAGTIFVLGYWFRIGEFSACRLDHFRDQRCTTKQALEWTLFGNEIEANNMLYIQNAIWTMWVTGTTVGYGDIFPITHVGRLVAAASAWFGLIIAALFTASLANSLIRSPQEEAALNLLRRNKAKQDVLVKAVNLVQIWWRKKKGKKMPFRHRRTNPYRAMHEFTKTKFAANAELNSMKNISGQLTDLHREGKVLYLYIDEMHDRTEQALLAIVRAAKEAHDVQHFLQNRPEPPPSRGGEQPRTSSHPGPRRSSLRAEAADGEEGTGSMPRRRRKSLVEFFGDGTTTVNLNGEEAQDASEPGPPDEKRRRTPPANRQARPRRKSTVEFSPDGRRASVTTYYS